MTTYKGVNLEAVPTYDAMVYQSGLYTTAVDKNGTVLSSVLTASNTDHIPIQAALTYIPATGGLVYICAGAYVCAGSLTPKAYTTVMGAGVNNTTLTFSGSYTFVLSNVQVVVKNLKAVISSTTQNLGTNQNLSAAFAIQPTANPAVLSQSDMGTNTFPLFYATFTNAGRGTERVNWVTQLGAFETADFTAQVEWTTTTTLATTCIWELYAIRVADTASYTTALPLVATFTADTAGTAYTKRLTVPCTQFTVTGTGETILWEVKRKNTDTTVGSVLLLGVKLMGA